LNTVDIPLYVDKIIDKANLNMPGRDEIEDEIYSVLKKSEGIVSEMCLSLLLSGGKRIRPLMVIYSGMCFSKLSRPMVVTAVSAELIHMASLVHDDIIDMADSRRGIGTINSMYGNHSAVLTGDFLFAKAFSILSSNKLIRSMEYLVDAIDQMCGGEINQARDIFKVGVTIEGYFKRIREKTGILISSCCKAGAAAAGVSDYFIGVMGDFGMNIGCAYQIIDDILDFIGDEKRLGKPTGMDLINGNITLPIIMLMKNKSCEHELKQIIRSKEITKNDISYIHDMLEKEGIIDETYRIAQKYIAMAKSSLNCIPDTPYRSMLLHMADRVIERDS
jgi:heptaprenyl diphosphate synthase